MSKKPDKQATTQENVQRVELSPEAQGLHELLKRTDIENPSEKDKDALRLWFEKSPGLLQMLGDVSHFALEKIVNGFLNQGNAREALLFKVEQIKKEMGRAQAPVLEKILIDQIGLCWADLHIEQYRYTAKTKESHRFSEGEYWLKRLNAAQVRYLRACETLARVRKLSRPSAMQVNIGAQQVNVTQGADQKQIPTKAPEVKNVGDAA